MPDLELLTPLADAYANGATAGRALRWIVLLGIGAMLVRRVVRGSFGPGFRRSPAGTALGLVAVVAGLIFSVASDFNGGPDLSQARANVVAGCMSQGQTQSLCDCYADEVLRRTEHDPARFAALEREMVAAEKAGTAAPAVIVESATLCAQTDAPS